MDLLIPKHCASGLIIPWQCHQFPESRFSLLFSPISLEPLRGRVETAGAPGGPWHSWLVLSLQAVSLRARGTRAGVY